MLNNTLIDNSIETYLRHYYDTKPNNVFDFRDTFIINPVNLFHSVLLSDYSDCERVYNFCRDISRGNYTDTQKREMFLNILEINN